MRFKLRKILPSKEEMMFSYRLYLKLEKFIKWILDDDVDLRKKRKKPKRGKRIRTDGKK